MRASGNFCLKEPITVQLVNVQRTKVAINLSDLGAIDEDVEDAIFRIWAPEDLDETAGECPRDAGICCVGKTVTTRQVRATRVSPARPRPAEGQLGRVIAGYSASVER